MTSLSSLRAQLSQDFTRDPKNHVFPVASVDRALNKAYERLQTVLDFGLRESEANYSVSATVGTYYYALPSDFMRVSLVRFAGDELYRATIQQLKRKYDNFGSDTGRPVAYFIYGDNLGVYPVPDTSDTIDMEYKKLQAALTSDQGTGSSGIIDDSLCAYASYLLFRPVDKPRAVSFLQDANEAKNNLMLQEIYNDENIKFGQGSFEPLTPEDALSYYE